MFIISPVATCIHPFYLHISVGYTVCSDLLLRAVNLPPTRSSIGLKVSNTFNHMFAAILLTRPSPLRKSKYLSTIRLLQRTSSKLISVLPSILITHSGGIQVRKFYIVGT
jgi:hypothetical protein